MKKLITLLAFGFCLNINAQNYISYFGGSGNDVSTCSIVLTNGLLVAGSTTSFGAQAKDVYISKIDFSGNILWSKMIGGFDDDEIYSIVKTSDKNYVLTGYTKSSTPAGMDNYNALIMKIDSSGNLLWAKVYGGMNPDCGLSVIEAKNKDIIVSGFTSSIGAGSSDMLLMRTDSTGNLKWFKSYGGTDSEAGNSLVELDNGDIACVGTTIVTSTGTSNIVCIKTDSTGQLKWQNKYNPSAYNSVLKRTGVQILYLPDKNLLLTGKVGNDFVGAAAPYLLKLDTAGAVLWGYSYTINSGSCGAYNIYEMPSSIGYIMYAYMGSEPVLLEINTAGYSSWCYNYTISSKGGSVNFIPNIGFEIIGSTNLPSDSSVILIQTNINGTAPCDMNQPAGYGNTNALSTTVSALTFSSSSLSNQGAVVFTDTSVNSVSTSICTNVSIEDYN
jgi:hypothetical protein